MKPVKEFRFDIESLKSLCSNSNLDITCLDDFTGDWLAEDLQDLIDKGKDSEFYGEAGIDLIHHFEMSFSEILYEYMPAGMTSDELFIRFSDSIFQVYDIYFRKACVAATLNFDDFNDLEERKENSQKHLIQCIDDIIEHYRRE